MSKLSALPSSSINPSIFHNFMECQLEDLCRQEELLLATTPMQVSRPNKNYSKTAPDSTGLNMVNTSCQVTTPQQSGIRPVSQPSQGAPPYQAPAYNQPSPPTNPSNAQSGRRKWLCTRPQDIQMS